MAKIQRAEEAALKVYPKEIKLAFGPLPGASGPCEFDDNLPYRIGFKHGYEQAEKDIIDCACQWLFSHLPILLDYYDEDIHEKADRSEFIKLFRTQMEEQ